MGIIDIVILPSVFGQTTASISTIGGPPTINFSGVPGFTYRVQVSPDLSTWTTISTNVVPSNGKFQFTDNNPPQPHAFYRLEWSNNE
jgi:hypothetical protein